MARASSIEIKTFLPSSLPPAPLDRDLFKQALLNLFLNGITEAINGDPVGGLINAFGNPIAADVGLTTLAGGFELITLINAGQTILTGVPNPGPQ